MRVLIATQSWGVVTDEFGNAKAGRDFDLATINGTPVTPFDDISSATPEPDAVTNASGEIPGYIETGPYNLTVDGVTKRVEAVAAVPVPTAAAVLRSNRYRFCLPSYGTLSAQPTNNRLLLCEFPVPSPATLVRIGCEVVTAGSAGCVLRPAIYQDRDFDGVPDALILDPGTIAADVAAIPELVINTPLDPSLGPLWAGGVVQGNPAVRPFIRSPAGVTVSACQATKPGAGSQPLAYYMDGVNGALPALFVEGNVDGQCPRTFVKAA